jgi:ribonuclease P protein subunit POP4
MKMTAVAEVMKAELIGLDVEVLSAPFSGISGRVVDETKNTFTIESAGTERMVPKSGNSFRFTYRGEQITIEGNKILHRPENRLKKVR